MLILDKLKSTENIKMKTKHIILILKIFFSNWILSTKLTQDSYIGTVAKYMV